jgi:hypothetical protein
MADFASAKQHKGSSGTFYKYAMFSLLQVISRDGTFDKLPTVK